MNAIVYNFSGEVEEITHLFPNERMARIAAIVRSHGHTVHLIDRANFADLAMFGAAYMELTGGLAFRDSTPDYARGVTAETNRLLAMEPDVLFMNLWHGSGFKFSMDLAAAIKSRAADVRIYGIGQKVDWFTHHILELVGNELDGLVTGLGYNAVDGLARGLAPADLPNMILRNGERVVSTPTQIVDVDDYPPPVYEPDIYEHIDAKIPIYSLALSNQACPNRCAYCVRPHNYGRTPRRRSSTAVLAELQALHDRHGVTHIRIEDSTPPPKALTAFCHAVADSPMAGNIRFSAFSRVDTNRSEDFELMGRAGILSLFFGLESLDDERLHALQKGFRADAVTETLQRAHEAGIRTVGSFIFPTPGETRDSMRTTLERLEILRPLLDSAVVLPAGIYPPTEWGQNPEKYGILLADDYIEASITYPIRYLVPIRYWKPLPFTYDLMGRPADEVTFEDIVTVQGDFTHTLRETYGLPGIPDYYFLLADYLGRAAPEVARDVVGHIMRRDYDGLEAACRVVSH